MDSPIHDYPYMYVHVQGLGYRVEARCNKASSKSVHMLYMYLADSHSLADIPGGQVTEYVDVDLKWQWL